jgi:hypothetical protein
VSSLRIAGPGLSLVAENFEESEKGIWQVVVSGVYFIETIAHWRKDMVKKMDHMAYQKRLRRLPCDALRFIVKDAKDAIAAMPDGPNAGYYADEINYAAMELVLRERRLVNRSDDYHAVLTQVFKILKKAGYNSYEILDDLRDLVNDSQRPSTEEAARMLGSA